MERNGKQFKQFLQSKEFSVLVESIVGIYTRTLVKKIENLEEQLKNFVNFNQTFVANFSKNEYENPKESVSKNHNDFIGDTINEENVNLVEEYTEDLSESVVEKTLIKSAEDAGSTHLSGRSSETSSACSSTEKFSKTDDNVENVLFDKDVFIKHVHLPKNDYEKSMVLGIYSKSSHSDRVVFESKGKRYWIHLDNCKPRSRSEKIVKTRLEETLPGNKL